MAHTKFKNKNVLEACLAGLNTFASGVSQWIDRRLLSRRTMTLLIVTAILYRGLHFFSNPSLWLDEANLALNIIDSSFRDLLGALERGQMAPPGFLLITKLFVELLGATEYIFRTFPFICGITSIFVFRHVITRILEDKTSTIALGLFAISPYLVHYSAEFKQYSSDVAIALILYAFTLRLIAQGLKSPGIAFFFLIGTLSLALSHASAFVLTGIGLTLAVSCIQERKWLKLAQLSACYLVWLCSFLYLVCLFTPEMTPLFTYMQSSWEHAFMPLPPSSLSDLKWFENTFLRLVRYPLGLYVPPIIGLVFLAGCVSMFTRNRQWLTLLLSPILIALIVSGFRLYPFAQRMLLYSVPAVLIVLAEGIQFLRMKTHRFSPAVGLVLAALVFYGPAAGAGFTILTGPPYRMHHTEEIRPVLGFIQQHKQKGDMIYLYYASAPAFNYYAGKYGLEGMRVVDGRGARFDWTGYKADLERLKGHERVWILFSHVRRKKIHGQTERDYILDYLDLVGERKTMFAGREAWAYLYDLTN